MTLTGKLEAYALAAALILVAGMGAGWNLWSPERAKAPKIDPPAVQVVQGDGSTVLERKPDAAAKPVQQIPKGGTVVRVGHVTIQPNRPEASSVPSGSVASVPSSPAQAHECPPCPPVRVDFSVIRMPDLSPRVIVSSPDGKVLDGVDIPVEAGPPAPTVKLLKRAAGVVYGTTAYGDISKGAFYDHDFGFIRTGAEITQNTYSSLNRQGWELRAKLGIRF